jgi:hypothetical protein
MSYRTYTTYPELDFAGVARRGAGVPPPVIKGTEMIHYDGFTILMGHLMHRGVTTVHVETPGTDLPPTGPPAAGMVQKTPAEVVRDHIRRETPIHNDLYTTSQRFAPLEVLFAPSYGH